MSNVAKMKRGDTAPVLLYEVNTLSSDMTGATAVFSMKNKNLGTVKVNKKTAVIDTTGTYAVLKYNWEAADTDTAAEYEGEFKVTFADGTIGTYPGDAAENFTIEIDAWIA